VNLLLTFKSFWVYTTLAVLLVPSIACTYKPAYLQQGRKAQVPERWKVEKINSPLLSPDEKSVYETMGPPQFIRFYRKLSPNREKIYAWVYAEPVRFVTFVNGKKIDYAVLDDDPSSLSQDQQKRLLWGGITAGAVVGLGGLMYYFFAK